MNRYRIPFFEEREDVGQPRYWAEQQKKTEELYEEKQREKGFQLQSLGLLRGLGSPEAQVSRGDIIGLLAGGGLGWYIAKRYPNMVVKYIGIVVGAELGILVARLINRRSENV